MIDKPLVKSGSKDSLILLTFYCSINFCPRFFALNTLLGKLSLVQNDLYQQGLMNNYEGSKAMILFENTWRLRYTVCNPQQALQDSVFEFPVSEFHANR